MTPPVFGDGIVLRPRELVGVEDKARVGTGLLASLLFCEYREKGESEHIQINTLSVPLKIPNQQPGHNSAHLPFATGTATTSFPFAFTASKDTLLANGICGYQAWHEDGWGQCDDSGCDEGESDHCLLCN